ncbi:SCPU domain-containing protein [Sphingomonas parva]|uniref:SCPU domain-containing protein n=1 Tax=Sphingomonas parva TaxID=2555898 RepID=A0A4Y8ZMN0_9SPHN|nr:spore coat U domain-containing protein [Sphingomonas parva]TFI57258.1 SCPU domain-containing protein [Sphingomonas parva]
MPRNSLYLSALLAIAAAAGPAQACTISAVGVAFGTYDPKSSAPRTGFGRISLDCHPNARPVIALGAGLGGNLLQRRMSNGRSTLNYNLYTDAGLTSVWGDGTGGTLSISAPKKTSSYTVYGRIPAGQNVSAGSYSDVLIVTVIY